MIDVPVYDPLVLSLAQEYIDTRNDMIKLHRAGDGEGSAEYLNGQLMVIHNQICELINVEHGAMEGYDLCRLIIRNLPLSLEVIL